MTLHPTRLVPGNAQHQGDREQQQDSFGFSDLRNPDGVLVVVADGIGDHALGKEASWLAINTLLSGWNAKSPEELAPDTLQHLLRAHPDVPAYQSRPANKDVKLTSGRTFAEAPC
ncbi:MAG: protein phosphatase 2C domain-containing protein [Candidatus Competibacteraceae bacterium]|nr:protein phosphatase 2C domain-containing protein [Candidatus Competibacteraceae bacterium]